MARRGQAARTREEWAAMYERARAEVEALRAENRKIAQSLGAVLRTRSQLRDEVADSVAEEIDGLSAKIDEYQCLGDVSDIQREREAFLRALGVDDHEWDRVKWRYL